MFRNCSRVLWLPLASLIAACAPSDSQEADAVAADVATAADRSIEAPARTQAATRLIEAGPRITPAIPTLLPVLDESNRQLKALVTEALAGAGSPVLPEFIQRMGSWDPDMREYGTFGVLLVSVDHDARSAGPAVMKALGDENRRVRAHAIRALWFVSASNEQLDEETVVNSTVNALSDEFYAVRQAAAFQLGWRNAERAVPDLAKALDDPHPMVAGAAQTALRDIGSQDALSALAEAGLQ